MFVKFGTLEREQRASGSRQALAEAEQEAAGHHRQLQSDTYVVFDRPIYEVTSNDFERKGVCVSCQIPLYLYRLGTGLIREEERGEFAGALLQLNINISIMRAATSTISSLRTVRSRGASILTRSHSSSETMVSSTIQTRELQR